MSSPPTTLGVPLLGLVVLYFRDDLSTTQHHAQLPLVGLVLELLLLLVLLLELLLLLVVLLPSDLSDYFDFDFVVVPYPRLFPSLFQP
jgi:hypothetical protein